MALRGNGIYIILIMTIIATVLAITADMEGAELGAIFNYAIPPFAGLAACLIFLIVCWLSKDKKTIKGVLIACCIYLLYVGLTFKLRPGYIPIPL